VLVVGWPMSYRPVLCVYDARTWLGDDGIPPISALSNANLHAYWCCSIFHVEIFCLNKRSFCLEEHPSSSRALHQLQCTRFWKYITHPLRLISTRNTTHLYEIRCTHCRVLLQFSAKCFVQDKSTCNTGARWAILHRQVNHGDYAQSPASSRHTM
jgi:hypothetical protein